MGNLALNNALSGILSNQEALDVISQNIANASDENYSRQRAILKSNQPLFQDGKFFGTGVNVEEVRRVHNDLIGERLRRENQTLGRFNELKDVFQQVESVLNEPSETSIRGTFSDLESSLQNLANDPENRGGRSDLIGRATTFASVLKRLNRQFQQIGGTGSGSSIINEKLQTAVREVNNIAQEISTLNAEIATARARGGNPNDLLDERDQLVNELSRFADIQIQQSNGDFRVNISGYTLVQNDEAHELSFARDGGPKKRILYDDPSRSRIRPNNGRLRAMLDVRDEIMPDLVNRLNDLAVQFVDRFNDRHRAGFGLDGQTGHNFFDPLPTQGEGVFRLEGMGTRSGSIENQRAGYIDSPDTVLAGNSSTAQPENFEADDAVQANPTGQLEINGNVIGYDMTEDTIRDVIDRINRADNQAAAYLSAENRLVIKGSQENQYTVSGIRDSGLLLEKTNLVTVGGDVRTSNALEDPTVNLVDSGQNFDGNSRIDATTSTGLDLAEGSLEFERRGGGDFAVNYDARTDSATDLVGRINTRAQSAGVQIRSGVDGSDRMVTYAFTNAQSLPAGPGVVSSGNNVVVDVNDASAFEVGQKVGFADNNSGEITQVESVNESTNQITVDLANSYDPTQNGIVTTDLKSSFRVDDVASQQLRSSAGPGSLTVNVADAGQFEVGDEVVFTDDNNQETATVTAVNGAGDQITVDSLANTYSDSEAPPAGAANNNAAVRVKDTNEKRNLLSVLGYDRRYNGGNERTEFALRGEVRRPPVAEQVASLEVSQKIRNNPDLIAAAKGTDTDLDGIAESSNGPGDGSNALSLAALKGEKIMRSGTVSPDEHVNEFITDIGSRSALVQRQQKAAQKLVDDIKNQRQQISGVNINQELTRMIQHQQVFQASARVISTVQQLNQSLLQIV